MAWIFRTWNMEEVLKKSVLVSELRDRQRKKGIVSEDMLSRISDQTLIECYMECGVCHKKILEGLELERFILEVMNTDEFVNSLPFPCGHVKKG